MTDDVRVREGMPPEWSGARPRAWALAVGLAGLVTFVAGVAVDPAQAYFSYLTAYLFAVGIALGALALIMIESLIAASWFVAMRRLAEIVASTLPAFAVLFIPIGCGVRWLYPWTNLAALPANTRALVAQKTAYLNLPFFFTRAAIYLLCWIVLAELLRHWSLRQDRAPGERWTVRQRTLCAPGIIVYSFTLTFAAFDWVMSLAPGWFSTIFGVQIFSGAMVGALALLAVLVARGGGRAGLADTVTPEHFSALGKMLFTFVIFWAYVTFAQILIIWIADVPDEVLWYIPRIAGSWRWLGVALIIGHFAVPFFLLLSYELKRRAATLVRLGGWLLAMHYLEGYWIVMPQLHPASARPHWLDASAAAMVIGLASACASWRARGSAMMPIGDPELAGSLRYSEP